MIPAHLEVHVVPTGDLIRHDPEGDDCPCGPTQVPVEQGDGSMRWVVVHHSLDGRERSEQTRPPK